MTDLIVIYVPIGMNLDCRNRLCLLHSQMIYILHIYVLYLENLTNSKPTNI